MSEKLSFSITMSESGADIDAVGTGKDIMCLLCSAIKWLSEQAGIPVTKLAADMYEAIKTVEESTPEAWK